MKAIILAAGIGSRLQPITNTVPKCLVEVNGISILERQIDSYISAGINEIIVVAGHLCEMVMDRCRKYEDRVRVVVNSAYKRTNNMYSFFLTEPLIDAEFMLSNGDVAFDKAIIVNMLKSTGKNLIAAEKNRYLEESMKITVQNGLITHISKLIPKQDSYGTSIDVYMFSKNCRDMLFRKAKKIIEVDKSRNDWMEVLIDSIFNSMEFVPFNIGTMKWVEIDNHEDLAMANELFK